MFRIGGARVARKLSVAVLAVVMLSGVGLPLVSAAPTDPVTPVDRLSVDQTTQTASLGAPGGSTSLTTTMQATTINPVVDIIFVLDTTGSMNTKIATMQQGLAQFVKNITDAGGKDLAFGVMIFGSLRDGATPRWTRPLKPLSSPQDLNYLFSGLGQLDSSGNAEDMVHAGFTAAATAPWRPGAQREEIVVGDIGSREWPTATSYYVNGQPPTLANWKAYTEANDIRVHVVDASGKEPGWDDGWSYINTDYLFYRSFTEMGTVFGTNPSFSTTAVTTVTAAMYVTHLTDEVVFNNGNGLTFTIEPKVSVTYADGTPSTDVVATASPPGATTVGTSGPVSFTLTASAVAMKDIARPGATSTAYVEFVDQGTGSIVARQTVTFTAPNNQTVSIVFVDDHDGGSPVNPKPGFKASYSGLPGQPVGFTQDAAQAGIPDGYVFASMNNITNFGTTDETITVHLRHGGSSGTVTTTRTVHYTGAGASNPPDVPQTVTWDTATDTVTHITTYTARTPAYPELASPVVPGYTADKPTLEALAVTSPTTTAPGPASATVTYTPNTQVVNVVYVDDGASGAVVDPVAGFQSRRTGPSGSPVGFTQAMAEDGVPAGYVFESLDNVITYDFDDSKAQTITVHLAHALNNGEVSTVRTIHYAGAGGETPADVRQTLTWDTVTDAVTNVTTYTAKSSAYPARTSPVIDGYTADKLVVPALSVTSPTQTAPGAESVTVTYSPNTQVVNVVFVDDQASGAVVEPAKGFQARLTGPSGSNVGFTQAQAEAGVPAGYVIASIDNVSTYDFKDGADQQIKVHLVHGLTRGTVETTRTITYTGAGASTPPVVKQPLTWSTVTDDVTHVTTYTATQAGYVAVTSPLVPGYTPDKAEVAALVVRSPLTSAPGPETATVTYTPNTQVVNVVFVDDEAAGAVVPPANGFQARLTGPSGSDVGFTQAMAERGVPAGYVFASLGNVPKYDFDDAADQTITVHLNHGLRDGTVSTTRTIHYTGAGTRTPADVSQPLVWDTVTDAVTNVTTYTAKSAGYPASTSPVIDGYTADKLVVAAAPVTSPTTTAPVSVDATVTYSPNTQVVNVVFVDDQASRAVVPPVAGFQARLTGLSGSPVGFTPAMAQAGIPAEYVFASVENVAEFDYVDAADQTITVHLVHRLDDGTFSTTRTIHYAGAGTRTPADVTQSLAWDTVTDAVTRVTTYTAKAAGYPESASPVIDGYTADVLAVAAAPVQSPVTTTPVSVTSNVTYTPNTQVVNVVFVDDESAGAVVPPANGFQARLTGLSGSAVGFTRAMAEAGVPAAYVFESLENVDTYDYADRADQTITVHLKHGYEVTTLTTTRSINYAGAGESTPAGVTQKVDWVVTKDLPSGVIVYTTNAAGYPAVPSPALNGYTPDVAKVDAVDVSARTLTKPVSSEVVVTYAVNQQRVNVRFVDDDASGALVVPKAGFAATLTGPGGSTVGFTSAMAESGAPDGYVVMSLGNVAAYDLDDQADQTITVHLAHLMVTENLTVTRTIHYTGAGDLTPGDEVQKIEWTATTDAVTMVTVYTTDAKGYDAVVVPVLAGHTVDRVVVDALTVEAETLVKPVSTTETVKYTKIVVQTGGVVSSPGAPGGWVLLPMLLMGFGVVSAGWAVKRR